jgi:Family of unknown function (DUF5678)
MDTQPIGLKNSKPAKLIHPLQEEFHWYLANQNELVKRYRGRYLAIAGQKVIGDFNTIGDAYQTTIRTCKPGTFIIKFCIPAQEERPLIIRNHDIITFE